MTLAVFRWITSITSVCQVFIVIGHAVSHTAWEYLQGVRVPSVQAAQMQLFRKEIQVFWCISSYYFVLSMALYHLPVGLAAKAFRCVPYQGPFLVPSYSISALLRKLFFSLGVTLWCIHFTVSLGFDTWCIWNSAPALPGVPNIVFFIVLKWIRGIHFYLCSTKRFLFFWQGMENCSSGCQDKCSKCITLYWKPLLKGYEDD